MVCISQYLELGDLAKYEILNFDCRIKEIAISASGS
jgi:hypothetical protein